MRDGRRIIGALLVGVTVLMGASSATAQVPCNVLWVGPHSLSWNDGSATVTKITISTFAAQSLAGFDVIYVDASAGGLATLQSRAGDIASFVSAGGGLVTDNGGNFNSPNFSWVPNSGSLTWVTQHQESVALTVDGLTHPVMAGTTNAGLTGWGQSQHNYFTATGGMTVLTINPNNGQPNSLVGTFGSGRLVYLGIDPSFHQPTGDTQRVVRQAVAWVCEQAKAAPANQAPVAVCQDLTIELGACSVQTISFFDVDGGSFDPDGDPITLSIDKTSFDCADLGNQVVTLTVTDDSGLESTCEAIVTVIDVTAPALDCPDDILVTPEVAGGVPATDPAISAFLASATINPGGVNFEGFAPGSVITTQIAGLSITNGAIATDPVIVLGAPFELDTNGENTLINVDPFAPIVIDFDPPVSSLRLEGGAFAGNISVDAYDDLGVLIASDNFQYGNPSSSDITGAIELPMFSSALNISTLVITYEPSPAVVAFFGPGVPSFVIDDIVCSRALLVDFEGLPNLTIVFDQFEGVEVSNGGIAKDPVDVLGNPTDLDPDGDNSLGAFPVAAAPIVFTFDEPASNITFELASFAGTLTVDSFDAGGFLIDSESFSFGGVIGLPIALSVSGASSIEVSNTAGYVVDDLAFTFGVVECDPEPLLTNDAPGIFPVGDTTVTFTVTDASGNSSSCSATVTVNTPPTADAGGDQADVECTGAEGAGVTLDGSASSDPDAGDSLSFEWFDGTGASVATTATVSLTLPLGPHTFTLVVTDSFGASDSDSVTVTVVDTTAPTITSTVAVPDALWPPNHKMIEVVCNIVANDACDSAPPTITLLRVVSNESDNGFGIGDGNTSNDIQVDMSTSPPTIKLRSERAGKGDGRIYTLTFNVTDAIGNTTEAVCTVEVPKNAFAHSCDNPDCDLNSN